MDELILVGAAIAFNIGAIGGYWLAMKTHFTDDTDEK